MDFSRGLIMTAFNPAEIVGWMTGPIEDESRESARQSTSRVGEVCASAKHTLYPHSVILLAKNQSARPDALYMDSLAVK
jgi:hypothetical protein